MLHTHIYEILTSRPGWMPGKACWNLANLWRSLDALTLGYPAPVDRTYSRRSRRAWKRNVALSYKKTSGQNNRCNLPWRSEYPFQDELVQSPAQVKDHFVSSVQKVHSSRVDAFVAQLWNKGKHGWNHCDLSSLIIRSSYIIWTCNLGGWGMTISWSAGSSMPPMSLSSSTRYRSG